MYCLEKTLKSTINWNGSASSEAIELTFLIKKYVDIFALNPYKVGKMEVICHGIDPHRILYGLNKNVKNVISVHKLPVVNIFFGLDNVKFLALFDLKNTVC